MPRRPHPARTALGALALGALLAAVLAGCTAEPTPAPSPAPTKTPAAPIFATDEEAYAAAEGAYERYVSTSLAVTADGGRDADRLRDVASGAALELELEYAASYADANERTTGTVSFDVVARIQHFEEPGRGAVIQLHVCEDIEQLDILDADGNSVVRDTRTPLIPYEVTIIGDHAETLNVDERVLWDTATICW